MVVKDKKIGTAKYTEEATKHMARPSRWDEYETALLVEAYIKVTENGGMKTQVLQELSDNLRQMAVNKGLEIDDVYRNLNGMMWQYTFIEKAFKKSGFGQHFPAKVFRYVVELYLYNRKKFDEILKEAKKRIDPGLEIYKLKEGQMLSEKTMSLDDTDDRIVNFSERGIYKGTRPYQVLYKEEELEEVKSWANTYVTVARHLYKRYPQVMNEIADSFAREGGAAIVVHMDDADKFIRPVEVGGQLVVETNRSADSIIWNIKLLLDKFDVSYDDLKIYYRKLDGVETIAQNDVSASIDEYVYQKEMRMILQRHYAYGYRINSSIELNRFKNFAEMNGVVLPDSDERIKAEIRNAGYLIGDKVYIISDEILSYLNVEFCKLYEEGHRVFFYECIFSRYQDFMEENHISSADMLKEILKQSNKNILAEYKGMYFAKKLAVFSIHENAPRAN